MSDPIKRAQQLPATHKALLIGMGLLAILIIFVWAGPLSTAPIVLIKKGFVGIVQFRFEFEPNPRWDNVNRMHFDNVDWINLTLIVSGIDDEQKVTYVTLNYVGYIGTETITKNTVFEFSIETGFLQVPASEVIVFARIPNAAGRHSLTWNAKVTPGVPGAKAGTMTTYDFYNHEFVGDPENTQQDFVRDSTWELKERGTLEKYGVSFSPLPIIFFSIISIILLKKKKKGEQNV